MATFWEQFTGGTKTDSTTTVVTEKPSTNVGLLVGGIVVGIVAIVGLVWVFGGFKKKP